MFTKLTVIIISQYQCQVTVLYTLNLPVLYVHYISVKLGRGVSALPGTPGRVVKINNALLPSGSFCPCGDVG